MRLLATPRGRASGAMDHVVAAAGSLACAAGTGAVLTVVASAVEARTGAAALPLVWALGAVLMGLPLAALPLMPAGVALLLLARRFGAGGALVAMAIACGLAGLALARRPFDTGSALVLAAAALTGLAYWAILAWRCRGDVSAFTDR